MYISIEELMKAKKLQTSPDLVSNNQFSFLLFVIPFTFALFLLLPNLES